LWKVAAGLELMAQEPDTYLGYIGVNIALHPPTKRSYDLDNRIKAILDLLVSNKVIEGDSEKYVRLLIVHHVDDMEPGAEIMIIS
jgi:Holliday junction resolvase RusA-like endonuclease